MKVLGCKRFSILILIALCGSGCGKRPTRVEHGNREQILHYGNGAEVQDLDPHIVTGVPEHHIITALLEGLVSEDPHDLHPIPGVAERWEISPDQKTYTFFLRKNARWSNGQPVTARDFVESYQRMLSPGLASEYAYMLHVMKGAEDYNTGKIKNFDQVGVKALDDYKLEIQLNNPTPYFLSLLNHYSWYPVHIPTVKKYGPVYERGNRWTLPKNFVGNGPFTLTDWKLNQVIIVKKSPTFWDAEKVRLKQIYFYAMESDDSEERAFRSGQIHLTTSVPLSKIDVYKKNHPEIIRQDPYLGIYYYRVNVTKAPMNNKRVRQALSMAIDREAIVKIIRGGQLPAYNFTPSTAGYTAATKIPYDIEGAKKLLAEAGYPDGKNLPPVEILFNTLEAHRTIAEAVQQMWKNNLHIDARLVNQEWKVYLDSQRQLNYQVCRAAWIGDYPDPNSFLDMWLTAGGNNQTGWSNAEYDRLIKQASEAGDQEKRYAIFQKAEALLLDEMPVIPIYFYTRVYLIQPSVKGWFPNILDSHPYKYVYLESPQK
ncbi:MAG: peptide ABC transporter substrate-binding protein [Verrucomicrobiota bacterium]|nr:peptide ABC transporter substrate-binding protein [Verrucomicrobiota bacterium]